MKRAPTPLPQELVTGHQEVDAQHAGILAQLESLRSAAPEGLLVSTAFLTQHVRSHFAYEELLMSELQYPEAASHGAEHRRFAASLAYLKERVQRDGATFEILQALVGEVEGWVATHVLGSDRRLAAFVRGQRAP
jgi:hemerythrin-like metal-binding protein